MLTEFYKGKRKLKLPEINEELTECWITFSWDHFSVI